MGKEAVVITPIYHPFGKTFTKPLEDTMLALGTGAEDTCGGLIHSLLH